MPVGRGEEIFKKHRDYRLWRENKIREQYEAGHTDFRSLLAAGRINAAEYTAHLIGDEAGAEDWAARFSALLGPLVARA